MSAPDDEALRAMLATGSVIAAAQECFEFIYFAHYDDKLVVKSMDLHCD
ncbi:hypothetical protein HMPREF9622_01391 [Cutibacterium modestum HL037PA3]|uniref:Uncharacterized protein n=1 Tax=Cutibacterium modestum HL044PA1 TaxID=765109 RepID=A0ABP2K8I4_9ACTN|nr:hypothetical protein HMPREF9621_01005 [Cutibacterium modestum HL037PA2]EFS93227.1 hypothetical protein HMPREF9607_00439 [Cutibacterium modestum HL044PA1]EFT15616.1 hypothetical protein HMPREF9622_01391 [Cutibacterium modestum HL037PA3]EGG27654.1 hypothetical protein PA08_0467 [Cutibacterium modestum P08]